MKLERFKEKNNKMIGVVLFTIICILLIGSVILYKTFASFEVNHNFNIINGTIQEMGDLEFAFYIDNDIVRESPSESEKENYVFDEENSSCTNGATVYWDYERWGPTVLNLKNTKTKCYLKFKKEYGENILNGAVPIIKNELMPITIDNNGIVKKADITSKWYSYESQEWANAVITKNSYELLGNNLFGAEKKEDYVHLDGVDDYIDLGLPNYEFHDQITLAMNVSFDEMPNDTIDHTLFGNWEAGGGGIYINNHHFTNYFHVGNGYEGRIESDEEILLHTDYIVILTYDGTKVKMYINGKKQTTEVSLSGDITASVTPFSIGANPATNGKHSGFTQLNVKQAAIFNRAINESEIADISNNFKITNGDKLLKYVDFTNKEYESNEVISEDNIESYFVWIPKYRYLLWDLGEYENNVSVNTKPLKIKIIFGDYNTLDAHSGECTTPMISGSIGNCQVGDYMTHPAFLSIPSKGFWVGKYETGRKSNVVTPTNERNKDAIIIKPGVTSWRTINPANAFYTSFDYQRELDSHMMKNTEWGAVAYLSHSAFGIGSNMRPNNNSNMLTGFASKEEPYCDDESVTCNFVYGSTSNETLPYNTDTGYLASTTGNITGIYDMSGGAWEYMMAVMQSEDGRPKGGMNLAENSGFNGPLNDGNEISDGLDFPNAKYYDLYMNSSSYLLLKNYILGDTAKEIPFYRNTASGTPITSWYQDRMATIYASMPWVIRGGYITLGVYSGIFALDKISGVERSDMAFRLVLTPS